MGTITARKRKDGSVGYTAQILRKKGGRIVFREAKTFDKKREAESWIRFRETEIDKPGALERLNADRFTLADAIDRYVEEKGTIGATKDQVLRTIKTFKLATIDCADNEGGLPTVESFEWRASFTQPPSLVQTA